MRVAGLKDQNQLRKLIRALRENNVVEEDDGFHHIEVTKENFLQLWKEPSLQEVSEYMTGESRKAFKEGTSINGWYGAKITPTWEPKHGN